jgi:hypothetical protein
MEACWGGRRAAFEHEPYVIMLSSLSGPWHLSFDFSAGGKLSSAARAGG